MGEGKFWIGGLLVGDGGLGFFFFGIGEFVGEFGDFEGAAEGVAAWVVEELDVDAVAFSVDVDEFCGSVAAWEEGGVEFVGLVVDFEGDGEVGGGYGVVSVLGRRSESFGSFAH